MRWTTGILAVWIAGSACLEASTGLRMDEESEPRAWASFSVAGLEAEQAAQSGAFLLARADSSFRMGLLTVPPGPGGGLISHRDNAVYYVASGSASLRVLGDTVPLVEGTVVFVPGDAEHRIRDVSAETNVVVYLARGLSAPDEPGVAWWDADELTEGAGDTSAWRVLLESSTVGVGVYTLPKGGGGDEGLSHGFVEYKLVMEGGGRFDVGDGGIEAAPGSMVLIPAGVRHRLRRVSEDLAILFVWKR